MSDLITFQKVTRKPISVNAFQLTEEIWKAMKEPIQIGDFKICCGYDKSSRYFLVQTLEDISVKDLHRAEIGDWLIKGVHNEIYACKPDIFHKTYEIGDLKHTCGDECTCKRPTYYQEVR
jgi:hypothetical protein